MQHLVVNRFEPEAVVLCNGNFPTHPTALSWLERKGVFVACCDGAANDFLSHTGFLPDVVVGDGDSISLEWLKHYGNRFHRIGEQETNDMSKCVHYLKQRGLRNIAVLGATGKREDHTIGNISLLVDYLKEGLCVRMYTDYGVFIPCQGSVTVDDSTEGQTVSIFSFGVGNMSSDNLKYPLHDLNNLWQGTLNQSLSSSFTIHAEGHYLLYLAYERE